jgi:hypothetical protein
MQRLNNIRWWADYSCLIKQKVQPTVMTYLKVIPKHLDLAMVHIVTCWLISGEVWIHSQDSTCENGSKEK